MTLIVESTPVPAATHAAAISNHTVKAASPAAREIDENVVLRPPMSWRIRLELILEYAAGRDADDHEPISDDVVVNFIVLMECLHGLGHDVDTLPMYPIPEGCLAIEVRRPNLSRLLEVRADGYGLNEIRPDVHRYLDIETPRLAAELFLAA